MARSTTPPARVDPPAGRAIRFPARPRLRWASIACGLAVFAWLGPEDQAVWPVASLGALSAALLVWGWARRRWGGLPMSPGALAAALTALGALAGLGANLTAVSLMIFKDFRHAHPFPDYPPALLAAVLARAPAWGLAGALLGLGLACALVARHQARPGE